MDYKNYHNEVVSMQYKVKDCLDDPQHTQARELTSLFQKLEDDVQVQKNIHSIRDQLKQIESALQSLNDEVMSRGDVERFIHWVRDSLQKIR